MAAQHPPRRAYPEAPFEELLALEGEPASEGRGKLESRVLFAVGGFVSLFGVALATAPEYSWGMTNFAQALAAAGVESGTLLVGGLVLMGIGLLARQRSQPIEIIRAEEGPRVDTDIRLVVDPLVARLTKLSAASLQVTEEVARMNEVQRSLFTKIESKDDAMQEQRNALFRLASSLDKLSARLDERFHAFDLQVRGGLDNVLHALERTRHHLEGRSGASDSRSIPQMSPGFSPSTQGIQAADDLHVLVDLEDPAPSLPQTIEDESADFFGTSLETLDELTGGPDRPGGPPSH